MVGRWDGRAFLGWGLAVPSEASSQSEHNFPGAPLSTHLPARMHHIHLLSRTETSTRLPPLFVEGGPPELGSGLVRSCPEQTGHPLSMSGGPDGGCPKPLRSEPTARTAFSSSLLSAAASQEPRCWPGPSALTSEGHMQPVLRPGPGLRFL